MEKAILILGAGGQLGQAFRNYIHNTQIGGFEYHYFEHKDCDITDTESVRRAFLSIDKEIYAIINCAAYTNVDKAEIEPEIAESINVNGVKNIVSISKEYGEKCGK